MKNHPYKDTNCHFKTNCTGASDSLFKRIYEVVKSIPKGCVMNYGTVAAIVGRPRCSRFVGFALHQNPSQQQIPCHRVVFKDGSLSPAFAFGGIEAHKALLIAEGVTFKNNKVNMKKHAIMLT